MREADSIERPAIECRQLTKRFGAVLALDDLDLSVPRGSVFGFLGRNGAGKTTAMRLLSGLARPSSGKAWIDGVETTRPGSAVEASFGYLPQGPAFYGWMSAVEYLDYVSQLHAIPATERHGRIADVLALAGLDDAARRPISGFSGGMKQRLGIAQALVHRPKVLLLDEPTSSLDPAGRHRILEMLDSLRGMTTVFFSTHILQDVERICDRIAIIHRGRLLLVENRESLLARHATQVLEIELQSQDSHRLGDVKEALSSSQWVSNIKVANNVLRLAATDQNAIQAEVLALILHLRVPVMRLQWVRPSLEEIFLQLSADDREH